MKKRLFLVVCCAAILFGTTVAGVAATADSYMLPDHTYIVSIVPKDEDEMIVESQRQLAILSTNVMRAERVLPKPQVEAAMVAYSEDIMAVTAEGQLLRFKDKDWLVLGTLPIPEAGRVIWAQRIGDEIIASFAMDGAEKALLAGYDTAKETARVITKGFGNGWFYPVNEHVLGSLFRKKSQWLHCVIDLRGGSVTENPVDALPADVRSFAFSPTAGLFYLATPDSVWFGTDLNQLKRFSQQGGVRDVVALKEGKAALLVNDGIYVRMPQADTALSLTVLGIAPPLADRYFLETGVKIEERQTALGSMEDIATMLSSRDASIDLFCFFSDRGLDRIKEKGLYVDLAASAILTSAKGELYPAIAQHLSCSDSELMAWPVYIESWFARADGELLHQYGFDTPTTFDELVDLFPRIIEAGVLQDQSARMFDIISYCREEVLTYFIQQYLFAMDIAGEKPDFFDPDVLRILQKIVDNVPVEDPAPSQDGTEIPLFYLANVTDRITDACGTGFRVAEDQPSAVWSHMLVMVVNPYSARKAEAVSYLEFLTSHRGPEAYTMYASMTDPVLNPQTAAEMEELNDQLARLQEQGKKEPGTLDMAIVQAQGALEQLESRLYVVDPDSIARYHELARHLYISEGASLLYNSDLSNVIAQLAQGKLDIQGFSRRMNQIIRLIYLEGGK